MRWRVGNVALWALWVNGFIYLANLELKHVIK